MPALRGTSPPTPGTTTFVTWLLDLLKSQYTRSNDSPHLPLRASAFKKSAALRCLRTSVISTVDPPEPAVSKPRFASTWGSHR